MHSCYRAVQPTERSQNSWVLRQKNAPPKWQGLKYFNVYGPFESHKGNMASTANQKIHEALDIGTIQLFKSNRKKYKHGEQRRDFVFVHDVVEMMKYFFLSTGTPSGIYNVGSGISRSFNDLANSIISAIDKPLKLEYFDMPEILQGSYQYATEADMSKFLSTGFKYNPFSLEQGIHEYVHW